MYTENERIWQWLDEHTQEVIDYWAAKSKDASQVEQVAYDEERHSGMLMVFSYQGVVKIVSVTPQSLLEGLSGLDEEIRQLCIASANDARDAADLANEKAEYAKEKADSVALIITDLETLKEQVRNQGEVAEEQGNNAEVQAILAKEISDYPPVWKDGFLWVYDANAEVDEVMGKRVKTTITAVDFTSLTEEERVSMMEEFIRTNNAPSIEGSTLVFPAASTVRIDGSTLLI